MSPAATITGEDALERILAAADDLFYTRGVAAVTMADLRDASGVSMRRLYNVFATKSDVVAAWLRDRHDSWMHAITTDVAEGITGGAEPLDAVFAAIERWMITTDFRGCGFINTHAAGSNYTATQREIIGEHKASFAEYLNRTVADVPALAVLIDGAIVHASIYRSVAPLRSAHQLVSQRTSS